MAAQSLNVTFDHLPDRRVVFLVYQTNQRAGNFDTGIRGTFDRVKSLARGLGAEIASVPAIGIARVVEGRLEAYECCIPITIDQPPDQSGKVNTKVLPGGKYAVLKIDKRSPGIGETIGRFFQEYVPTAGLQIDHSRPTYEVYWERTLDFCVPILG